MGRLKRKKTSAKKKTKAAASEQSPASQAKPAVETQTPQLKIKATKASGSKKVLALKRSSKPAKAPTGKQNIVDKSLQFLREVRVELKKVTWPSRKQTMGSTGVVLVLVIIIAAFLGLADIALSSLIRVVLQ